MAAAGKSYFSRGGCRFLPGERDGPAMASDHPAFEFEESDIWNVMAARSTSPELRRPLPASRPARNAPNRGDSGAGASSLPVEVPDWSEILGYGSGENAGEAEEAEEDGGGGGRRGDRVPPHEFLARTRMASASVQEGAGRTLKGRDLSRVRNAIWEKTGFQD